MAKYVFNCKNCGAEKELSMSISEFQKKKKENYFNNLLCAACGETTSFSQKFHSLSSKIKLDRETLVEKILDDSRKVVEKVRSGDQKAIRDIYGEDK